MGICAGVYQGYGAPNALSLEYNKETDALVLLINDDVMADNHISVVHTDRTWVEK